MFQQKRKVKERFQLLVLQQWRSLQGLRGCALHSEQLLRPKIQSSDGGDDDGGGGDDDGGGGDDGGGDDGGDDDGGGDDGGGDDGRDDGGLQR